MHDSEFIIERCFYHSGEFQRTPLKLMGRVQIKLRKLSLTKLQLAKQTCLIPSNWTCLQVDPCLTEFYV